MKQCFGTWNISKAVFDSVLHRCNTMFIKVTQYFGVTVIDCCCLLILYLSRWLQFITSFCTTVFSFLLWPFVCLSLHAFPTLFCIIFQHLMFSPCFYSPSDCLFTIFISETGILFSSTHNICSYRYIFNLTYRKCFYIQILPNVHF